MTMNRTAVWQSESSLWSAALRQAPTSSRVRANVGRSHFLAGDLAAAGEVWHAALALDPYLRGVEWRAQRAERNPFGRSAPYASALPELAPFLQHLFADGPEVPPPWTECVS